MFNAPLPRVEDLPTSFELLRSTLTAAGISGIILVTVLLPSEYAVDPTRVGRLLGLTQMGEIKLQLAAEQASDKGGAAVGALAQRMTALEDQMRRLEPLVALAQALPPPLQLGTTERAPAAPPVSPWPSIGTPAAPAPVAPPAATVPAAPPKPAPAAPAGRKDQTVIALKPDQGLEVKMRMRRGAEVRFNWQVDTGHVNFDSHGEPPNPPRGFYHGYGTGRPATKAGWSPHSMVPMAGSSATGQAGSSRLPCAPKATMRRL